MDLNFERYLILFIQFVLIFGTLLFSPFFDTPELLWSVYKFRRCVCAFLTCCSIYLWLLFFTCHNEDTSLDIPNFRPIRQIYKEIFSDNVVSILDWIFDLLENPAKLAFFTIGVIMNCSTMNCWRYWMKNWYQLEVEKRLGIAFMWLFLWFWCIFFIVMPCVRLFRKCIFYLIVLVDEEAQEPLLK